MKRPDQYFDSPIWVTYSLFGWLLVWLAIQTYKDGLLGFAQSIICYVIGYIFGRWIRKMTNDN